jgi:hypothetical protein
VDKETREVLEKTISELQAQMKAAEEKLASIPEVIDEEQRAKTCKEIIKNKGLNIEYAGEGILFKTKTFSLGNGQSVFQAQDENNKAAPVKRKRKLSDYRPTEEELESANGLSNIDLQSDDFYVFEPLAANTEVDSDFEEFEVEALDDGARMTRGFPTQLDHERSIRSTVGKLLSGRVANKKLYQKFYVLDIPENAALLKNIAAGIYNSVSVSFGTELKDYQCNSCKRPVVSQDCPHRPGTMDEGGKLVTVKIKRMAKFYELSLVWLGAQPKAGIRRDGTPNTSEKKSLETEAAEKSYDEVVADLQAIQTIEADLQAQIFNNTVFEKGGLVGDIEQLPPSTGAVDSNEASTFDRIIDEKSLISHQGDESVDETQEQAQETVAAETEVATEVAEEVAAEEQAAEAAQEEPAAEQAAEEAGEAEEAKSLEVSQADFAELRKAQEQLTAQVASLVEMVKANNEALEQLNAGVKTSREEIILSVLESLPEQAPATKAASEPKTLTSLLKLGLLNEDNK